MTTFADCWGYQSPALIKSLGFGGVSFYISHTGSKTCNEAQLISYRNAGLLVQANFEDSATNALGGRAQGNLDGAFAANYAKSVGYPRNCVILFSIDFQPIGLQLSTVKEYLIGCAGYGFPIGVYGNYDVCEMALTSKLVSVAWQTAAWSGGYLYPGVTLYQDIFNINNQTFDSSKLLKSYPESWGWLPPATPTPVVTPPAPPKPKPVPTPIVDEEEEMPYVVKSTGTYVRKGTPVVKEGEVYVIWPNGTRTYAYNKATEDNVQALWGNSKPLTGEFLARLPVTKGVL